MLCPLILKLILPAENSLQATLPHLNTALASWPSVSDITGSWRIPTIEEVRLFAATSYLMDGLSLSQKKILYCYDGSDLKAVTVVWTINGIEVKSPVDSCGPTYILRPVIDITY